ncbi:hypothetical protein LCGC14_0342730 [marine sediment metagenome]|uniref:Uncharacterized protein n=1 Tax=marine sediment metagenome TaxID=412755 RepID=A0A0F9TDA5_9ZZZZ
MRKRQFDDFRGELDVYENELEFITDLMNNVGIEFIDYCGRSWKYKNRLFWHKDLGDNIWIKGIFCLHLYAEGIKQLINQEQQ